jgi:ATP-binding cassette subfamily B protein
VEFKSVGFRYPNGQTDVLSDVTLEVLPGQKVALVGRSGSGKTTLANLLLGLYKQTNGTILVDGVDLARMHKPAFRRQVGVVEQHPFLFNGTIRENIAKAEPAADLEKVVAASTMAGAHTFVSELPLGYDTQIGERGMTLSGGQRQRLAIARAILGNPRMLVLDEATSSLDTESERVIQKNLDGIMAGRTAFVIAQRLSTVRNADQIVVLDDGRIVETGTHDGLMERRGLYHYLNAGGAGSA